MAGTRGFLWTTALILVLMMLNWIPEARTDQTCPTRTISISRGEITSPNYPNRYYSDTRCTSTIIAPKGANIKIEANPNFVLESDCDYDYLKIWDGDEYRGRYCGTNPPDAFTSLSNEVKLEFRSDGSQEYTGFKVTYTMTNLCEHTLEGQNGIMDSTLTDFEKTDGEGCDWIIKAPVGQFVRLDFKALYDRVSANKGAGIEVFDVMGNKSWIGRGNWKTAETSPPNYITSLSSEMKITIGRSVPSQEPLWTIWSHDNDVSRYESHGLLEIHIIYGCDYYGCEWNFYAPPMHQMHFRFENVGEDACKDLTVFDYDGAAHQSYILCDAVFANQTEATITVTSRLKLKLNDHNYAYGEPIGEPILLSWASECGNKLTQPGERFGENVYFPNLDCEWEIEGSGNHIILLNFESTFDIESPIDGNCSNDYIEVFDSLPGDNLVSLGRYCGVNKPPQLMSSANRMVVRFHTDDSKENKGFIAFWDQACGATYTTPQGIIQSPEYPSNYPDNFECTWNIQVPNGHLIQLSFNDSFFLEETHDCEGDYLQINDYQPDGSISFRGAWCGTNPPPLQVSMTSRLGLVFHSDGAKNRPGFLAHWTSGEISSFECGGEFDSPHGEIISPGYPQAYPNNLQCRWEIRAPKGKRIKLKFGSTFDIEMDKEECRYDGVEVLEMLPNRKMMSYGNWCSVRRIPMFYSMTKLVVLFYSDGGKSGKGFSASWDTDTECGGTIIERAGHLSSPNYPSLYPVEQECQWLIKATPGDTGNVTLHFDSRFDLEEDENCAYDYVEIHSGENVLGRWCGKNPPPDVISGGHTLLVVFKSDKSVTGKGFMATLD